MTCLVRKVERVSGGGGDFVCVDEEVVLVVDGCDWGSNGSVNGMDGEVDMPCSAMCWVKREERGVEVMVNRYVSEDRL